MEQVWQLMFSISFGLMGLLAGNFISTYASKKGENLATRQDIGEITAKIEGVKATLENHKQLYLKHLDIEAIKLNRALPVLEELNVLFARHRMMYLNYLNNVLGRVEQRGDFETERASIDEAIVEKLQRIVIYLPSEYRGILYRLRRLVSVSFQNPKALNQSIKDSGRFDVSEVLERSDSVYTQTLECFYSMTRHFCSFGDQTTTDYGQILRDHGFNDKAELDSPAPLDEFVEIIILFPEYYNYVEKDNILTPITEEAKYPRIIKSSRLGLTGVMEGICPLQASGLLDGKEYYFRERHEHWTFAVADKNEGDPAAIMNSSQGFYMEGNFADTPSSYDEAERIIKNCAKEFLKAKTAKVL